MADITMCKGTDCILKEKCYRYTTTLNELMQSYFVEVPIENGECVYYIPDAKERAKNYMRLKKK